MTRSTRRVTPADFGPLYHGTSTPRLEVIDQRIGGHRYPLMPGSRGFQYATTSFGGAQGYARTAGHLDQEKFGREVSTVYEVQPMRSTYGDAEGNRYRYHWGVDENYGPNGWKDNYDTKSDALERARQGAEVALKFESPLKAREIWSEDRAIDLTEGLFHDVVPYRLDDGTVTSARAALGKPTGKDAPWGTSISFT